LTAILAAVLTSRGLVVYGDTANLISLLLYAGVTLLFYDLFRPVNKYVSLLAAICSFAGCVTTAFVIFNLDSANISPLAFFGPYCALIGYLILRSTFVPRMLGVLMVLAGLGWVASLVPALASDLATPVKVVGFFAEAGLMVWLLVIGVDVERWRGQAAPPRAGTYT
jgi:hypothetical protein